MTADFWHGSNARGVFARSMNEPPGAVMLEIDHQGGFVEILRSRDNQAHVAVSTPALTGEAADRVERSTLRASGSLWSLVVPGHDESRGTPSRLGTPVTVRIELPKDSEVNLRGERLSVTQSEESVLGGLKVTAKSSVDMTLSGKIDRLRAWANEARIEAEDVVIFEVEADSGLLRIKQVGIGGAASYRSGAIEVHSTTVPDPVVDAQVQSGLIASGGTIDMRGTAGTGKVVRL